MKRQVQRTLLLGVSVLGGLASVRGLADPRVVVSALASPDYTERKFGAGKAAPESYVVMPGHHFEGFTVERSIDRMPFRRIAEVIAPELAKQNYWPAKDAKDADLLIVVHWGTTNPPPSNEELRAQTSVLPDYIATAMMDWKVRSEAARQSGDLVSALLAERNDEPARLMRLAVLEMDTDQMSSYASYTRIAQLLGYVRRDQRQYSTTAAERGSLLNDIHQERYFIILRGYDLHARTREERSQAIWTVWLNMSSPGNNFQTALARMGMVAADYVGRTTHRVETVREPREGRVTIGPVVSHGEAK